MKKLKNILPIILVILLIYTSIQLINVKEKYNELYGYHQSNLDTIAMLQKEHLNIIIGNKEQKKEKEIDIKEHCDGFPPGIGLNIQCCSYYLNEHKKNRCDYYSNNDLCYSLDIRIMWRCGR